jgi:EmrB/QacA subfamily drug resistance transporter
MKEEKPKKKGFQKDQVIILITLMIASFLGRLDGTIVNLALPKIIKDFGITVSQASWISTAYIIANAIFVPIFGKLGDLIGRKALYIFGIVGFTLTSMLAGLSFNLQSMVIFRILQAITVSIDYPVALSIIAYTFKDRGQRTQAMGLWSAIFAVAAVFGPLLGGPLIDNFSWRSVFYINIPLGILGTWMAIQFIHEPKREIKGLKNFDIAGALLLGISLGALVLVLDQGSSWGWGSLSSIISYLIVAASFILFLICEKRQKEPIVDLKFFKISSYTSALITSFISFMGMIGGIFLIPLFVQTYLGYSTTKTGYLFIPMAFMMMISAQIGARLSMKVQPRFLVAGGMLLSASILFFSFAGIDIKWGPWDIIWRIMLFSSGLGIGMAPLTNSATSTVPLHEVGVASSILALVRNIAGAFGVAIFASILSNSIISQLLSVQRYSTLNTSDPTIMNQLIVLVATKANVNAYSIVFQIAGAIMMIGAFSAFFIKENKKDLSMAKASKEHPIEF